MYLLAAAPLCRNEYFISSIIAPMMGTTLMLTLLMLAIIYMSAQLFRKPEHESFVSLELYQLLVSVLLFIFIFGATCFSAELSQAFAGGDQFEIGRSYLSYMSNDVALRATEKLYGVLLFSQYMGSVTMRWGAGAWGVIIPTFPSFIVVERVVDFLLMLISPFTASLMVQAGILEAIRAITLPFILPAGVILRLFPPTRDASAFLIASALGFGIVFPYTYVMHNAIVRPMIAESSDASGVEKALKDANQVELADFISDSGSFGINDMIFHPLRMLSFLLLQALFLPALSITLTIAFIKGFSKFVSQKLT